jgi:NIPSNAP
MLFDMRIYTCRPGTLKAHLALYEKEGMQAQRRHLGDPYLYCITETGPQNSFIHVWAYASAADRAERRAAMQADPEWIAYLQRSAEAGYLVTQENRLLTPASFFDPNRTPSRQA